MLRKPLGPGNLPVLSSNHAELANHLILYIMALHLYVIENLTITVGL